MKRLILIIATAGALAALVGAAGAQSPTTLELVQLERDTRGGFVDNPPRRRESAGDVFTVRGRVRDSAGKAVGSAQAEFVQTGPRSAQGSATFSLGGGRIMVAGALAGRGDDTLAIVGGTGAYTGATGTVQIVEARGRTEFRFTFR
jgi:hypothetical protein